VHDPHVRRAPAALENKPSWTSGARERRRSEDSGPRTAVTASTLKTFFVSVWRRMESRMVSYVAWRLRLLAQREADEAGASLVEYALLVALIAIVCIVAVSLLGSNASNKFSQVGSALQ
jgi:pilus assembly protein Flp/PilA